MVVPLEIYSARAIFSCRAVNYANVHSPERHWKPEIRFCLLPFSPGSGAPTWWVGWQRPQRPFPN